MEKKPFAQSLLIFCLTMISAISTMAFDWQAFSSQKFEVTKSDERTMVIRGSIALGDYEKFSAVFDDKIKVVRVSSGGGAVADAVKMGLDMINNGVDVIVDGPCLSSCANYFFLAGKNKIFEGDGFVGYHGSPWHGRMLSLGGTDTDAFLDNGIVSASLQRELDEDLKKHPEFTRESYESHVNEVFRPVMRNEREFFGKVGVGLDLITNSLHGRFVETVPNCQWLSPLSAAEKAREPFFFASVNQHKEYGVTNISGEQNWRLAYEFSQRGYENRRDDNTAIFCVAVANEQDRGHVLRQIMRTVSGTR